MVINKLMKLVQGHLLKVFLKFTESFHLLFSINTHLYLNFLENLLAKVIISTKVVSHIFEKSYTGFCKPYDT